MKLDISLTPNKNYLEETLKDADVVFYPVTFGRKKALVLYIDQVTDIDKLGDLIIRPISRFKPLPTPQKIAEKLPQPNSELLFTTEEVIDAVIKGNSVILFDKSTVAISFDIKKYDTRAIAEPPTSAVLKGPRQGFTESIKTNLSMLRRIIKTEKLVVKKYTVGRITQTDVALVYISSVVDESLPQKVEHRIKQIDVDGVIDSSYIAKFIVEHKTSIFKQTGTTEKPDILTAKLLEGRVAIIVDGSPIALTVPYMMMEDFQSSEDYFQNVYRSNMQRGLRLLSIFLAIFLPAIFVSAQLFHLQIVPLNFLLTIVNSVKGIPLSPSFEMFFTLMIFEILNEASIRMPKYVGMALSIVGALVLGDTAVKAGIVSTPTIMIMALSGICIYTVPELVDTMSFLRLVFLLVAGSIGGYGIILLCCFLFSYLSSLENFDVPFLAPFAPLVKSDLKDSMYMTYLEDMTMRPKTLKPKNKKRMKEIDGRF